jgi:hypothetical protein
MSYFFFRDFELPEYSKARTDFCIHAVKRSALAASSASSEQGRRSMCLLLQKNFSTVVIRSIFLLEPIINPVSSQSSTEGLSHKSEDNLCAH